jgi:hypothetical protein
MNRGATRRIALALGLAGMLLASAASAAGPVGKKDERAVELEVEGPWTHPSGMVFPERVAGFARVSVSQFSGGEDNYGAGYELADGREKLASVTVYVYPNAGLGLDDHFEQVVADVADSHGSPPSNRGTVAVEQQGAMANGRAASWAYREAFGRREQDLESRALLFVRGRWFVKYRVTYPAGARGRVEAEIDDLLRALLMPPE